MKFDENEVCADCTIFNVHGRTHTDKGAHKELYSEWMVSDSLDTGWRASILFSWL